MISKKQKISSAYFPECRFVKLNSLGLDEITQIFNQPEKVLLPKASHFYFSFYRQDKRQLFRIKDIALSFSWITRCDVLLHPIDEPEQRVSRLLPVALFQQKYQFLPFQDELLLSQRNLACQVMRFQLEDWGKLVAPPTEEQFSHGLNFIVIQHILLLLRYFAHSDVTLHFVPIFPFLRNLFVQFTLSQLISILWDTIPIVLLLILVIIEFPTDVLVFSSGLLHLFQYYLSRALLLFGVRGISLGNLEGRRQFTSILLCTLLLLLGIFDPIVVSIFLELMPGLPDYLLNPHDVVFVNRTHLPHVMQSFHISRALGLGARGTPRLVLRRRTGVLSKQPCFSYDGVPMTWRAIISGVNGVSVSANIVYIH